MKSNERIKKCRLECGLTLLELSKMLGVTESTVQRYESGEIKNPKQETLLGMAKIFGCSTGYLMGGADDSAIQKDSHPGLPLLGKIAAGQPIIADGDCEFFSPIDDTKADFCLRVRGDSMIGAGIKDGDIVFIRRQPSVDDGEIAAVLIEDEATLKRVYITDDSVTLISENPKYKPMVYTKKQCKNIRILGKAVACHTNL